MTLATTATWELKRDDLITAGLHLCGFLNAAQTVDASQVALGRIFLQAELLELQHRGVILRASDLYEQTLTAGAASYSVASDAIDVEKHAILRTSDNRDCPVDKISEADYQARADKTIQGRPVEFFVKEGSGGALTIYVYPTPDDADTYTLVYPRVRKLRDLDTGTTSVDAPASWYSALMQLLAWRFSAHYKQSIDRVRMFKSDYEEARDVALMDETERGGMTMVVEPLFSRCG